MSGPQLTGRTDAPIPMRALLAAASRRAGPVSRALVRYDRRADTGRTTTWDHLADAVIGAAPSKVSVDIYDTVIVRSVVGDDNVLAAIGTVLVEAAAWTGAVEEFVVARRSAARDLPVAALGELYRHPALAARCSPDRCRELEERVETSLARAVPGAGAALERLRSRGTSIVFLTDMHLSRVTLWDILTAHGIARTPDELVISSEVGASKSSATLFRLAEGGAGAAVHVGNDLWGDVAMAERSGVRAYPVRSGEPTSLEHHMATRGGTIGSVIAGAARQARLAGPADGPSVQRPLHDLGADVGGQCLTAFVLWVRDQCDRERTCDVAFLARDGALPLAMARAMPADHWTGTRLSYVHANRAAWSLAAADLVGVDGYLRAGLADESSFLQRHRHTASFGSLLRRVGLTTADLPPASELAQVGATTPLPVDRVEAWNDLFLDDGVRQLVADRAAQQHRLVRDHIAQSGLGDRRSALVDIGWSGRLASHISLLLRDAGAPDPLHLHFGGVDVVEGVDIRRFAIDDSVAPSPFPQVIECVETFTQSGDGRAESFERAGDGRVSVRFGPASPAVQGPARDALWCGAITTARKLPDRADLGELDVDDPRLADGVRSVLTSFWTAPERRAAEAVHELWYESDDVGTVVSRIADPYRWSELLGGRAPVPRLWREGSLLLTRRPFRTGLSAAFGLRTLVRR